ncbi:MAG: type III-A CRISPR-associated protein Csm2 [Saprospiraceae bacterium]
MNPIKSEWITQAGNIDNSVVHWAEETGKKLAEGKLTSSTIRRFFGEMRRIQSNFSKNNEDVPMLKAKLAYDVGRKKEPGVKDFYRILSPGIEAVQNNEDNFNRFVKIAESIVAFHKLHYKGKED